MECKCGSKRIASFGGKVSDLGWCTLPMPEKSINHDKLGGDKFELEGYMPSIKDVCGGDYIEIDICLDCGHVQREWPFTEEEVQEIIDEG